MHFAIRLEGSPSRAPSPELGRNEFAPGVIEGAMVPRAWERDLAKRINSLHLCGANRCQEAGPRGMWGRGRQGWKSRWMNEDKDCRANISAHVQETYMCIHTSSSLYTHTHIHTKPLKQSHLT